jgi:hypothetical protein
MSVEEDYVRAILPYPPRASYEDRAAVMAAVLRDLDSPKVARVSTRRWRQPRIWSHRLLVVGVAALILAVFFVPLPRTSLFGRLDHSGNSVVNGPVKSGGSNTGESAKQFALRVLNEASLPPHARLTTKDVSRSLGRPLETPGLGELIDRHRLYLVNELSDSVQNYVETHLPKGAKVITTMQGSGSTGATTGLVVSLSVAGPHDYLAQLAYAFASVGPSNVTEIRVDSQTVWVPSRPPGELAPAGGIVEVTGYSRTSAESSSSVPVTVQLNRAQAKGLRAAVNALPLGPSASCMENSLLYRIVFRPAKGSASSFEVDGWSCVAGVGVTKHGRAMAPLYDATCSLLHAVAGVLPSNKAAATREASADCRPN